MKNKLHLLNLAIVFFLLLFGNAAYSQVPVTPCPTCPNSSNDFVSIGYKLGNEDGSELNLTDYTLGQTVNAWLLADFQGQGNVARYNLAYCFQVYQNGIYDQTFSGCYATGAIPEGTWVPLQQVTWLYGAEMKLSNLILVWQSNIGKPCNDASGKCWSPGVDIIVEAPLVASFTFTETCAEEGLTSEKFYFVNTTAGGQKPYTYNWTFGNGATFNSIEANPAITFPTTGAKTVTLMVIDNLGHTSTATAAITVDYCCDLALAAPVDIGIECDESILPANTGSAVATNNGATVTPSYSDVITGGEEDNEYIITRTWSVSDMCGNTLTDVQVITITDETPPLITCPGNNTYEINEGITYVGPIGTPTVSDNCDASVAYVNNAPAAFPLGVTTVIWTATDNAGNTSTCSQLVTVEDNNPVVIDGCAAIAEVNANEDCEVLVPDFTAEVETLLPDDGNTYTITQDPAEGTTLAGVGLHTVIVTVEDQSGNSSTCETGVMVMDVTPPTFTCPEDDLLAAGATCEAAVPDYSIGLIAADNCTAALDLVVTQLPIAGTLLGLGDHTVTITVSDGMWESSCSFTLTIEDNSDPVISECVAAKTIDTAEGCDVLMPDVTQEVVVSENCNGDLGTYTVTQSPLANTPLAVGQHTVVITVTDDAGNSSTCSALISVIDNTPPEITCPPAVVKGTNIDCTYSGLIGDATGTDNCAGTVIITNDAPLAFPLGETTVVWMAEDAAGNTAVCTQLVTVVDNDQPYFINCPEDVTAESNDLHKYEIPNYLEVLELEISVGDNCGTIEDPGVTLEQIPAPGTIVGEGTHTITIKATDDAGNTSLCQFILTVEDLTPDEFDDCPPFMNVEAIVCYDVCTAIIPDFMKLAKVSEGIVLLTQDPAPGTWVEGPGLHLVTLTATDQAGNTSECITGIFVYSVLISGCEPVLLEIEEGCEAVVPDLVVERVGMTALCGMDDEELLEAKLHIVQDPAIGEELGVGTHILTYTVMDEFNHVITSCSTTLTVADMEEPVVVCPETPYIIDLKAEVLMNRYGVWIVYKGYLPTNLATATDNCTPVSQLDFDYTKTVFTQMNLGWNYVTVEVTDASGNVGECTLDVLVRYQMLKNGDTENITSLQEMGEIPLSTNVYPNPTKGKLWLSLANLNDPHVTATVYNSAGTVVFNREYTTDGLIDIDLSDKVSGLYMLRVNADKQEFLHKIILESR